MTPFCHDHNTLLRIAMNLNVSSPLKSWNKRNAPMGSNYFLKLSHLSLSSFDVIVIKVNESIYCFSVNSAESNAIPLVSLDFKCRKAKF